MFASRATKIISPYGCHEINAICRCQRSFVRQNTTKARKVDIEALLKNPSWSVRETVLADISSEDTALISKGQLYHLLRLSALPIPASSEEEARLTEDLRAHLRFVQAIQKVDTDGVKPLQMIRDETKEAERLHTITIDSLKEEFEKEEVVGSRGRIRKRSIEKEPNPLVERASWDPLSHAGKTHGPYYVVNTAKDRQN